MARRAPSLLRAPGLSSDVLRPLGNRVRVGHIRRRIHGNRDSRSEPRRPCRATGTVALFTPSTACAVCRMVGAGMARASTSTGTVRAEKSGSRRAP